MFEGLQIEMGVLKALGTLLDGSGWTGALVEANIASSGTADSFLHASHVTRTCRAHQIMASSLYIILKKAFLEYQGSREDDNAQLSFEDWCSNKSVHHPQFKFWFLVLQIEFAIMIFIRAVREGISSSTLILLQI